MNDLNSNNRQALSSPSRQAERELNQFKDTIQRKLIQLQHKENDYQEKISGLEGVLGKNNILIGNLKKLQRE